jgi:hypothetical protein
MSKEPSRSKIGVATVVALVVGVVVLVTAVLPAEYNIDPLGTGRLLGLTDISASEEAPAATTASVQPAAGEQPVNNTPLLEGEIRTPAVLAGWNKDQPGVYRVDTRVFQIAPGEGMEFKYLMQKGAGMVYVWNATAPVEYEFHGEPEGSKKGTYESYSKDDKIGKPWGAGNFIAPANGIHGWFWENTTTSPVSVRLTAAGFFTGAREFQKSGTVDHKLEDVKIEPLQ